MARKPRFTQYEMNRYVEVQNLREITAESATGTFKSTGWDYVPYNEEEIKEILRLRKDANPNKPLLTLKQREYIGRSLGLFSPNEAMLMTNDITVATELWINFYKEKMKKKEEDGDTYGNYLFSDIFAPRASVKDANDDPGCCAKLLACCNPTRT